MLRSHARKIFRDVWSRKGRTLLVAIAIFIGVLGVVTLISAGDLMLRQLQKDLQQDKLAMLRAFVIVPKGVPLDNAAYLQTFSELPGVTEVQGNVASPISWKHPGDSEYSDGVIRSFSQPLDAVKLEPPRLLSGGRFPTPGSKEVAIELRMAQRFNLKVGDPIVLRILGSGAGGSPGEETWTISGILFHPYTFFGNNGPIPNDMSVYADYADAQYIAGFTGFTSIYARYTDYATTVREQEGFLRTIGEKSPYIVVFSYAEDPANNIFIRNTIQYTNVISLLALVAMIVSGFLVANVISAIVLEQNRQIGVMKSLGATRWDNFLMYSGIAIVYGLIGLVPGVLAGIPLGYVLGKYLAGFANAMIEGFSISPLGVGVGVVMGIVVPVLAAFVPVYNGTKVTILQAMTDLGISTRYGAGRTARLVGALHLPINLRQALSNILQKKGRLTMTVTTLTLAVAAFMGVYAVFSSLNKVINSIYDAYGFEIQVTPAELQDYNQIKALILANVPDVQDVYPGVGISLQVDGYKDAQLGTNQLSVTGLDPATPTFAFNLKSGTGWKDDPNRPGIIITSSVADKLHKKVGDLLAVTVGGKTTQLEIIGIDKFTFDGAFMEWQALATLGGLMQPTTGQPTSNTLFVHLKNSKATAQQTDTIMKQIANTLLANGVAADYVNQVKSAEQSAQQVLSIGAIFNMTAFIMAAVGAIGLLSTLSMSVFERQKEIGVMRSIGAGSGTIAGQFLFEGILVGIIAWIIGVPLGYLFGVGLMKALPFGFVKFDYSPIGLAIGLVGMLVIATIASLWPSISAARKTVSDILRYQ